MTSTRKRLDALEKQNPVYLPMMVVYVDPGEDTEQKVAEALPAAGVTEDKVRLMIVEYVNAPRRDEHGNLIESDSADA